MRPSILAVAIAMATLIALSADNQTSATEILGGRGGGLSHWNPRPTPLPIRPIHPIHPIRPIRPITPIFPWNPWYQPSVVVVPNYYYPPTRWDVGGWDGQTRNMQPPPQPQPARPPEKPKILEWNAAKGQAEVYNLNRWQETVHSQPQQPATTEVSKPVAPAISSEGTEQLNRWDNSLP